jgi:hypothetical protein
LPWASSGANIQVLQQSRDWLTQGLAEEIKLDEPSPGLMPPAQSPL